MHFISSLSSVAPSPCVGPRSKDHPSLPCSSRPCCCCCCCTAWPPPWASTNCAGPWWARMRARCGSITRVSRNPGPWKTTWGSRWIHPESRAETHPRGSVLWWVHVGTFMYWYKCLHNAGAFLLCTRGKAWLKYSLYKKNPQISCARTQSQGSVDNL